MKKPIKLTGLALCISFFALTSCEKDDDNNDESNGADCYTCADCQGPYGHLISKQYCVDGFDNRQDWLDMKATYEDEENQCNCTFD